MNLPDLYLASLPCPRRRLWLLTGIGTATFLVGALAAPERTWSNLLLASYYLLGLSLAGLFFVALQYVTGAGWSVVLRRVPEAMASLLPVAAIGIGSILLFYPSLYPWIGKAGTLSSFKGFWLKLGFFRLRAAIYLLAWMVFAFAILRTSRRQDEDGDPSWTRRNACLSAGFLVVFALTTWLSSFDWIMSLEPDWYSTILGVYNFAGIFASGLAAIILLVAWLQEGLGGRVSEEHFHDLGKLLFGFSTFWAYIWFSQYLLIWYANIPEETAYFVRRTHGLWGPLFLLNLFLNWVVPFLALLPVGVKRSRRALVQVAIVVLVGRWLDLYLMIFPAHHPVPAFGAWEIGLAAGAGGVFMLLLNRVLGNAPLVPERDPLLKESLCHRQ